MVRPEINPCFSKERLKCLFNSSEPLNKEDLFMNSRVPKGSYRANYSYNLPYQVDSQVGWEDRHEAQEQDLK